MSRSIPTLLLALLAGVAACAPRETADSAVVRRDSAGIAVVESTVSAWSGGEGWTVADDPLLDLAEVSGEPSHEFFNVTDATRLSDGSIVVADDGFDEIRLFSPEGVYRRTIGRGGEGPGEFSRLTQAIALPGDSILAYDYWLARLTVFTPDGEMARLLTLDGAYRPEPLFPLEDGGYVGMSTDFTGFGEKAGLHRMSSPIIRTGASGRVTDTLTAIPGHESVVFSQGDARALWGKSPLMAVHGGRVYLGSADSLEYRIHAPDGRLERLVRVPGYDLTLSDEEIRAEYDAFVPDPSDVSDLLSEIMDEQPDRRHRPAYGAMVIDVDGNVWLEGYRGRHEREEPGVWQVFDASGEWLGPVTLPPRFEVFRIGPDWILGARPDALDVEHVQLLSLSRG